MALSSTSVAEAATGSGAKASGAERLSVSATRWPRPAEIGRYWYGIVALVRIGSVLVDRAAIARLPLPPGCPPPPHPPGYPRHRPAVCR